MSTGQATWTARTATQQIEQLTAERDELRAQVAALTAERDAAVTEAQRLGRLGLSDFRRDMVEAAAFVLEYYESHRATTEWPNMQKTRDLREEAEAVADAFEQAGGEE